jgi:long-chain acyl-CoA synthetase
MKSKANFFLNPHSMAMNLDAPGVGALLAALKTNASIWASQSQPEPITLQSDERQWLLVETSGTSGKPKTVRRRPETWTVSFEITRGTYAISSADTYATLGSLGHSLSLFATLEALHIGADVCTLSSVGPRRQAQMLEAYGVTVLYATPTQLRLLVAGAAAAKISELPNVGHIFSGGGKLDQDLCAALLDLCPAARILEFFGASETSFMTISDLETPVGSVGRSYPGVELRIGTRRGIIPHKIGEVWVASPYLFDGYTSGASSDTKWDAEYLSIGEMGHLDEAGNLFLKGRINRMITVADQNVFPEEIEQVVSQMDGVEDCAVVAVPDPLRGNRIVCFVTTSLDDFRSEALRIQCRTALNPSAIPKEFIVLDEMPLLPAGKPDLPKLRALLDKRP